MDDFQRHKLANIRVCPRIVQFSAEGWESDDNEAKALQHKRLGNMLTPLPWVTGLPQCGEIFESGERMDGESKEDDQVMTLKRKCFTLCKCLWHQRLPMVHWMKELRCYC